MTHRYYVLWGVLIHVKCVLCSDWLTEWAWWAHPAYSELTSLILLKKRIEWSGLEKFNNVYFKVPQSIASDIMSVFRGLKKHFREGLRFCTLIPAFSTNKDCTVNVHFNASQSVVRDISVMDLWSSVFGLRLSSVFDSWYSHRCYQDYDSSDKVNMYSRPRSQFFTIWTDL